MVIPVFIVDNRQASFRIQSFESEAAFASYHHNMETLIARYICISSKHSCLSTPLCIGFAQSPDRVQLLSLKNYNLKQIHNLLDPKFTCIGDATIPQLTWGRFFVDGIIKIGELIRRQILNGTSSTFIIFLFSTDAHLLGNGTTSIDDGVKDFFRACNSLSKLSAKIVIRVICTVLTHLQSDLYNNSNFALMHTTAREFASPFTFHQLLNTSIHFGEEIRTMMRLCCPSLFIKIEFPFHDNIQCSLHLELFPSTILSADYIQRGLPNPELYSLVQRNRIDPVCLNGYCLIVKCPTYENSKHIFSTQNWYSTNLLLVAIENFDICKIGTVRMT